MSLDDVGALSSKIDGVAEEVGEIRVMLARLEERQVKAEQREHPGRECERYFSSLFVLRTEFESLFLQAAEIQGGRAAKKLQLVQLVISFLTALTSGGVIVALVKIAALYGRVSG
jgi:hypothetical protein